MIKKRNFKSIVATGVIALASATLLAACGSKYQPQVKMKLTGTHLLKY